MVVFELTMPHSGSWNGKWSGADRRYICTRCNRDVPKECLGKDYEYRWDDGWVACVSVSDKLKSTEAHKLEKLSSGFYGYDWMITEIINGNTKDGVILHNN